MQPNGQNYWQPDQNDQSPQPQQPVQAPNPQAGPVVTLSDTGAPISTPVPPQVAPEQPPMQQPNPERAPQQSEVDDEPIRWQGHEHLSHDRNIGWFVAFAAAVIVLMIIAIVVIQSITFAILVPVMAAALIVYIRRPPRLISYTLSSHGLHIDDRLHRFTDFKSFGVLQDGGENSIVLIPVQRFKPSVTLYFPTELGETIVDILGVRLPMRELKLDFVDQIIRKLRL